MSVVLCVIYRPNSVLAVSIFMASITTFLYILSRFFYGFVKGENAFFEKIYNIFATVNDNFTLGIEKPFMDSNGIILISNHSL